MSIYASILNVLGVSQVYLFESYISSILFFIFFFFFLNDTPPPEISPLPLHDALPIYPPPPPIAGPRTASTSGATSSARSRRSASGERSRWPFYGSSARPTGSGAGSTPCAAG